MKKYILGNYEMSLPDIYLLQKCIESHIEEINNFMLSDLCSKPLFDLYKIEVDKLNLFLEQLKRYGD